MSKTHHYARLPNNSHQSNEQRRFASNVDEDDDDDNEEIELGGEHRIRYRADDDDDDDDDLERQSVNGNASMLANTASAHHDLGNGHATTTLPGGKGPMQAMPIGTLTIILVYLCLSIGLTFYQKTLLHALNFPLTIVTYHLVIKFMLAALVRTLYRWRTGKQRVQLDWRTSIRRIAPTGFASGIDIGFSVWGLKLVSISLYTMTKSSTIIFILFFAILLGLEKKSWLLVITVGLVAGGLFMMTYESTQFDALGFMFILVGSLSSGIRWSLAQFVMQKSKLGMHNPVDMIYHMQPWMILILLPLLITFEGQKLYDILRDLSDVPNATIWAVFLEVTFGALLAFFMEIAEFMGLCLTSSLTLSIAGVFKDICQLILAVVYNNDQLSLINACGLVLCLGGVSSHLVHKYSTLTKQKQLDALQEDDAHFRETNISHGGGSFGDGGTGSGSGGGGGGGGGGALGHHITMPRKHSAQTVPLLEQTDSDDDSNMGDGRQSASDVIFDVLKRRDMQR